MNIAKGVISWVTLYLVGIFFVLTASMYALFGTVNAKSITKTLRDENTYSKVVPAVLSSAASNPGNLSLNQLPLQAPWVRTAAETAFPPNDLEQKSEVVINSTFAWLEGKSATPEFTIDFTQNKQRFGEELGKNLEQRLNALPVCSLSSSIASFNIYNATCLPPGINPAQVKAVVSQQIAADTSFLKDPVINSTDLPKESPAETADPAAVISENPLLELGDLQTLFENKSLLLWLLPIATAVFAVLGFMLAPNREKALRRLTRSFILSAIGLGIVGILLGYGADQLAGITATDAVAGNVLRPVVLNLIGQLQTYYFVFTGIGVALAIVLFAVRRQIKPTL